MKKMGHHFPKESGFSGSCSDASGKKFVAGYFRGGRAKHEDEAQDKKLIRQEVRKLIKRPR